MHKVEDTRSSEVTSRTTTALFTTLFDLLSLRGISAVITVLASIPSLCWTGTHSWQKLGAAHHHHHASSLGPVAFFSPFFKFVCYIRLRKMVVVINRAFNCFKGEMK